MRLFLPQTTLEEWALADKADLKDGKLVVPGEKTPFPVHPAVHFTRLVSGQDEKKLLSRVKTQEQLEALGADHFADSVVLGETAYEVVPGYVTEVQTTGGKLDPRRPNNPEADLLAAFLLNKMS
ncbi:MAG: hypothetical protein IRZ16_08070 [Myxococcaceae bacterium]|nr:hypothetical protein [Myxococcaceae bacterium]